jgi:hypothetical protein
MVLIFVLSDNKRSFRYWFVCILGLFVGGIPLVAANLVSFLREGYLVSLNSLSNVYHWDQMSFLGFIKFLPEYISLGNGASLKLWILSANTVANYLEGYLMGALLLLTVILGGFYWKRNKFLRLSALMLFCYGIIGIAFYSIPIFTWVHHWIIGTPFQYMAISLVVVGLYASKPVGLRIRILRSIFNFLIITLVAFRLFGLVSLEESFLRDDSSLSWDPSLTKIGYFVARHSEEAVFIAANWGVATQMYCLSNGKPNLVYEPFWDYHGPERIRRIIEQSGKKTLYLVVSKYNNPKAYETLRIIRDFETLSNWKEFPVEDDVRELAAVEIRKFSIISTH